MARKELIALRLEPEILRWLETYTVTTGKNISELIRDMLWNSYRMTKKQGQSKKVYEKKAKVIRKKITELSQVLSNPQNVESLVQTYIGLQYALQSWGVHFKGLERMLMGGKGQKKPRPNGVRGRKIRAEEKKP